MKERLLHHVTISVFCKPHDDEKLVLHGLDVVSPIPTAALLAAEKKFDRERPRTMIYKLPKAELTVQRTEIDEGEMIIYTLFFNKMHDVNRFCKQLVDNLSKEEKQEWQSDPLALLDDEEHLTLRLDKERLMRDKISITDDGNCYKVKASIAAYPRTIEGLSRAMRRILESNIKPEDI